MAEGKLVFLSYAREDAALAKRLYADLKRAGVRPWLDLEDLLPGQNWKREIEKAISSSDYFLALLSSASLSKRGYVQKELKQAIDVLDELPESNVYIIPARLDDCKPAHERMKEIHWVDLFPSYENGLTKILRVVRPESDELRSLVVENEEDLSEAGWGVIFSEKVSPATIESLRPLLELRREQATRRSGKVYKEFIGELGFREGDSVFDFLARHGAGPGPIDPARVPGYLLIVGDPEDIPFSFQQQLSVQYSVGRVSFANPNEYAAYSRSVLAAETRQLGKNKRAVFFGVRNDGDETTERATSQLVKPLAETRSLSLPDWRREAFIGDACSKERLCELLVGPDTPRLLFIVAHGVVFKSGDERQISKQGSIVCRDWPGPTWKGRLPENFYFSADDLPAEADLTGSVVFYFGSYGAGTPRYRDLDLKPPGMPAAPQAFVSSLAQRLLSNPGGGALALISQTSIGMPWSFLWTSAGPQTQTFEYALRNLMKGGSVGSAVKYFSRRYAEIAAEWNNQSRAKSDHDEDSYLLWTAAVDSKSYVVIGDPAVRIS